MYRSGSSQQCGPHPSLPAFCPAEIEIRSNRIEFGCKANQIANSRPYNGSTEPLRSGNGDEGTVSSERMAYRHPFVLSLFPAYYSARPMQPTSLAISSAGSLPLMGKLRQEYRVTVRGKQMMVIDSPWTKSKCANELG